MAHGKQPRKRGLEGSWVAGTGILEAIGGNKAEVYPILCLLLLGRAGSGCAGQRRPPGSNPATSETREMMIAASTAVQKKESMLRWMGV